MVCRSYIIFLITSLAVSTAIAEPKSEHVIKTVTVIGSKSVSDASILGTPIKELPLNAHIVGRAEIDRLKFVDPDELLDRIPGETQVRNLRIPDGSKSYTIPMVDGMPLESPMEGATQRLDRVNTFDIERVEVIKGPTSAIYPNNAFGGVVNVVTRIIPKKPESRIWIETGSFNRLRGGVNTAGRKGKLGYLLDINTRNLDGLREEAKNDRDQFSAKLEYSLSKDTELISRIEHLSEDTNVRGDLSAEELSIDSKQAGGLSSREKFDQNALFVKLKHSLEAGFFDANFVVREKSTNGASRFGGPRAEDDRGSSAKLIYRHNFNAPTYYAPSNLTTGVEFYRGDVHLKQYGRSDHEMEGAFTESDSELNIDAFFTQYAADLGKRWNLSLGARYENIELMSDTYEDKGVFNKWAPKLGLTFDVNQYSMLWMSIAEGFLAPSIVNLYNADTDNPDLEAEESLNFEVGLRSTLGNWQIDSSLYQNKISNYLVTQEFEENNIEYERTTNAGLVTVQGVESVIEYTPNSLWRVGLTHTYAKNTYNRFVSSDGDYSDKYLRRAPLQHFNARIAWEPIVDFLVEIETDLYSSYYSDFQNSLEGRFKRDERINIRLSYSKEQWRVWFNALNLTDTLEDRATYSRGVLKFRTVDGRTVYLGTSFNF